MKATVRELMTKNPLTLPDTSTVGEAAIKMKEKDIGDIIVEDGNGNVCGIVTDRDIVVRALANGGADPKQMKLGDICSKQLVSIKPDDPVETAVEAMRDKAVRRLLVLENQRAVGIVSIGDLAQNRDRQSALGQISAAPPNH